MNIKVISVSSTKHYRVEPRAKKDKRVVSSYFMPALVCLLSLFVISCSSSHEERSDSKSVHTEQAEQAYPIEALNRSEATDKGRAKNAHDQNYVKPGAAVVLADPSARSVDDLGVYSFDFGFIASPAQGMLKVSLGSSESLAIVSPQEAQSFDIANDELRLPVSVQATKFGRHVLTFFTELDGLRRVVSVTVQAGPNIEQDSQKTSNTSNAPKVIPMKAQETISNAN